MNAALRKLLLIVLAIFLLTSCSRNSVEDPKINLEPSSPIESLLPESAPKTTSVADTDKIPVLISIPALHVEAPVQPVGLDTEGRMATVSSAETVGWYKYGSSPGQPGNSILAGHRDWKGKAGSFQNIEKLKIGDDVVITFDDESIEILTVTSNDTYDLDEVPASVMDLSGEEHTTLITCTGYFDKKKRGYQSRAVVVLKETSG
ncbi:class F sortase [Paenibacillus chibensis]|uniref:class F sortase n=1 Tax=Paenibacillus chibensis TaxID=59846 RepID=UPI002DBB0F71|nr:class F sortase [Paenibacillus chibensis]MEC0373327.1 class F sortase [Paenibacillus chibensis]